MQGVDWKRVVELASAGELLREESLDRASRSLDTWRPDVEALPAVSQDLGLSEASVRLLVDLSLRLPPDAPREEVRRALAAALPADPTQAADVGTSPTIPGDASPRETSVRVPQRLGPYELAGEMGHGGMGMVFRARHVTLGTPYAVKVLVAGEHASAYLLERFHREASLVARMGKHPNIVSVHHMGQEGPLFYFAMDLVEGRTLAELMRERRLAPEEAARLMEKVARAVAFAHDHGVIHRDLKPENIMVAPGPEGSPEPQVMDFGLARDVTTSSSLTEHGQVLGTPNYMAPEQIRGEAGRADARTDVHALGAVLYELLTGTLAHPGRQIAAVFEHIVSGEVVLPRRLSPDLPADLETVCLRCLLPDPRDRYATAHEVADELARFLRGEPVLARPVTRLERAWRRIRRRPGVALLAAALVVTGSVAAASAWTGWRDRQAADGERRRLVEGYVREMARSGHALVEAALARRSVADMKGSAAFAAALDEPVRELIRLAPRLAEPWYHRGRMERALDRDEEAERSQTEAIRLAEAPDATEGSRAVLPLARYERGVIRAFRYVREVEDRRRELLASRAASLLGPAPELPTTEELEARFPRIPVMRQEAIDDLRRAGATDARALVARGLLAFLEGTGKKDVEADLERAVREDPYLTDAYLALAEVADDPAASLEWYRRGHQADRGFLPFVLSICDRAAVVSVRLASTGADGRPPLDEAIAVAEETLERVPGEISLWSTLSQMYMARTVPETDRAKTLAFLDRGLEAAGRALALDARHVLTLLSCARIRLWRAKVLGWEGKDDAAGLEEARRAIALAREVDPRDATAVWLQGTVLALLGQARIREGADPSELFTQCLAALREGAALDPRSTDMLSLGTMVHLEWAAWKMRRGIDPAEDFASAIALAEKAIGIAPESWIGWHDLGLACFHSGEYAQARRKDPSRDYARAREAFRAIVERNPTSSVGWEGLGRVNYQAGMWEGMNGHSPMDLFTASVQAYDRALPEARDPASIRHLRANVRLDAGRVAVAMGKDPTPWFREAEADIAETLRAAPDSLDYVTTAIELAWAQGESKLRRGQDPTEEHMRVVETSRRAIQAHPHDPDLWELQGLALRDRATWLQSRGEDAEELQLQPQRQELQLGKAREARPPWLASRLPSEPTRWSDGGPLQRPLGA